MTIDEIVRRNRALGHNWFEPETRRWFGSRIHDEVYGDGFFVTSERDERAGRYGAAWDGERRYTVRRALPDGSITTVGTFGGYGTRAAAHAAARRAATEADRA